MTFARLISPAGRSSLMILAGTALMLAPVATGLSVAAIVTGIVVGAGVVGLGIAGTDEEKGRGTLPLSAQAVYDRGLAFGLMLAALLFGIAGEPAALAVFGAAGIATLAISSVTSYSAAT